MQFLLDCGASSLIALKRAGVDRNAIDLILITHFHADHFGGVPFFMLDAQFFSMRSRPLTIAGPAGVEHWYPNAMETAFAGSSRSVVKFDLSFVELTPGQTRRLGEVEVTTASVRHGERGGPFHAYRMAFEGKVLAYTGDTEWTETLLDVTRNVDLLIAEAYFYEKRIPWHLSYQTLLDRLSALQPKRLILTHMSKEMLGRLDDIRHEVAEDGLSIEI